MEKTRKRLTRALIEAAAQIAGAKKTKTDNPYFMDPYSAQEMQEAFSLFDKNGDGKICTNELKSVMRALGQNPSETNITAMMSKVDKDNNGTVDYDEYCELIQTFCKTPETVEIELREAFRHFDKDRNGSLDTKELKGALMSLGDPMAEEDINELLAMMDADKNGKIDVEDFGSKMNKIDVSNLMDPYTAKEMQEAFSLFDKNGDGKICTNELKSVMRALGQNPTEKNLAEMMTQIDKDKSGFVDYNEYCDLIREFSKPIDVLQVELREAFRYFDKDRNGSLDTSELKGALLSLGDPLGEEDIMELFALMDLDKNGKVDVEEFTKVLCEPFLIKKGSQECHSVF